MAKHAVAAMEERWSVNSILTGLVRELYGFTAAGHGLRMRCGDTANKPCALEEAAGALDGDD